MTIRNVCQNPKCQKEYEISSRDIDDHYCSDACWEAVNCNIPEVEEDQESLKDIFLYKT